MAILNMQYKPFQQKILRKHFNRDYIRKLLKCNPDYVVDVAYPNSMGNHKAFEDSRFGCDYYIVNKETLTYYILSGAIGECDVTPFKKFRTEFFKGIRHLVTDL